MTGHKDGFQVQRLEVVNTGRRRRWSEDEKLRIVEESFQGHRQVSATARRGRAVRPQSLANPWYENVSFPKEIWPPQADQ